MNRWLRGCLVLVALMLLCCACTFVSFRLASSRLLPEPRPDTPVDVSGDCPPDVVAAYYDEQVDRLDRLFGPLEVIGGDTRSGAATESFEQIDAVDVAAIRRARDELATADVPACLQGVRDEEIALADVVIDAVETMQGDGVRPVRAGLATVTLITRVGPIVQRLGDAKDRLEERLGMELDDAPGERGSGVR